MENNKHKYERSSNSSTKKVNNSEQSFDSSFTPELNLQISGSVWVSAPVSVFPLMMLFLLGGSRMGMYPHWCIVDVKVLTVVNV